MAGLVACPHCSSHVALRELDCPHCGATIRRGDGAIPPTAAALVLGLSVGSSGCSKADDSVPIYGVAAVTVTTTTGTAAGSCESSDIDSPIPPGEPLPAPADAAALCAEYGTLAHVPDAAGVRAWLPRRWFHCKGQSLFGQTYPGVEIVNDGNWYYLDRFGDQLVRREGGSWEITCPTLV